MNWRANYQKIDKSDTQILKKWKEETRSKGFRKIWNNKGTIPYCYGLPKEKDIEKLRPIVSYSKHPMKKQFNQIGRILLFMLKRTKIRSLNLWKTGNIKEEIKEANKMIDQWGGEIEVEMEVHDIKEMYTCLPHKSILEAVRKVIELFQNLHGDTVTIIGNREKDIKIGKVKHNKNYNVNQIIETIKQDLNNAVFKCGTLKVIQTIGIPMGSPLSPALAITTCAIAENQMMEDLMDNYKFRAMRYMDDIWICTMKQRLEEPMKVEKIFEYYDKNLKVERERKGQHVRFLDREIIWTGNKLTTTDFNKNIENLRTFGTRRFQNTIPEISYSKRKLKKAIIVGKLSRVQRNTMNDMNLFVLGWIALLELGLLGYKKNLLQDCCGWMDARYHTSIWRPLFDCFMLVGNYCMFPPFNNLQVEGIKIAQREDKVVGLCESEGRSKV